MQKMNHLNAVWKANLETISDFVCGSGHVIPKHVILKIEYINIF